LIVKGDRADDVTGDAVMRHHLHWARTFRGAPAPTRRRIAVEGSCAGLTVLAAAVYNNLAI
jgi:hypothetical protein